MKMRPFNKAPFTISKFLSSGAPLPKMTFCRLRFYSQKQVSFDGTSVGKAQRVLIPNSIADQWLHGMQDTNPQGGTWLYLDVFKTFYRYYLCLGSKTKITIQRMLYPNFLSSITPSITQSSADQVFCPTTVGYWYVRCNYIRNGEQIGRAISPDGLFTENWRTLQQFMSDPTITYFKDSGVGKRVKTGFVMGAASPGFPSLLPLCLNRTISSMSNMKAIIRLSLFLSGFPIRGTSRISTPKEWQFYRFRRQYSYR